MQGETTMGESFPEMLEEFMRSPLVTWIAVVSTLPVFSPGRSGFPPLSVDPLRICSQNITALLFEAVLDGDGVSTRYLEVASRRSLQGQYQRLTDSVFLNEVMRRIDPQTKAERINRSDSTDEVVRVQNFSILNRHLRSYYTENLQQLILMPLPNIAVLGRDPLTEAALEELRRLLLLLLGCAVQCEGKEEFIQQIQSLDIRTQAAIAHCIQEVTQDACNVLPLQWGELGMLDGQELQGIFSCMAQQIQTLLSQREANLERIAELSREQEIRESRSPALSTYVDATPQSLSVQLADSRAKLRRIRQELEDKDDQLLDYKQEMEMMEAELQKLRQENRGLHSDARQSRGLRDELDCLRERAAKAERLQSELQNCSHRLRSLDLYRTQLQEQQQYCATLQETRALLEEQLGEARSRCASLRELERDNMVLRHRLIELEGERNLERQRVEELLEVNMNLESELKLSRNIQQQESDEEESHETASISVHLKPLSEEVSEASSLRLLGAENENMELRRRLEQLQAQREADDADTTHTEAAVRHGEKVELQKEQESLREQLQTALTIRAGLEEKQEELLKQMHNLKNENSLLRNSLEVNRGADEGTQRGNMTRMQGEGFGVKQGSTIAMLRKEREDGEGEEIYSLSRAGEDVNIKARQRGEGEGEKDMDRLRESSGRRSELAKREKTEGEEHQEVTPPSLLLQQALLEVERQSQEMDTQAGLIQQLRAKVGEQSRRAVGAEQSLRVLEAENVRLRKASENLEQARRQIEALQSESVQMEEEVMQLRAELELQRLEEAVTAQLQSERTQLERERDSLRRTVESLRTAVRKGDQLELTSQTLKGELERMGRSLESVKRREEELQAELRDAGQEMETLAKGRDQAVLEASRLEQEKEACQVQLEAQRREQRQRERELARMKQQLESTASALEHSNQRACGLETEHRRVCVELTQLREDLVQMATLEGENRKLKILHAETQAQHSALSQELCAERTRHQELAGQLEQLREQNRIQAAGPKELCCSSCRQQGTRTVSLSPQTPTGDTSRPPSGDSGGGGDREQHVSPERLSERLIDVERQNAVLQTERDVLLNQLSQSQFTCTSQQERLDSLHRQIVLLQENCTSLQALNTKLQAEQTCVWKRCSESEARAAALEAESRVWVREREEAGARTEAMRRDHERLSALQQRQEAELEALLMKHSQVKGNTRNLETQLRQLEARYEELLHRKTQLEEGEEALRVQMERLADEAQAQAERERELERLREESDRLHSQQKEATQVQAELLAQGSLLRGELSAAQLERTRLEGELSLLREQNQQLDLSNARLTSQHQLLTQLKGNMEEENRHLVEQNQSLARENRALLERSLESRDQHHQQQREYMDKLNELRREKQKLVEKIMDQYRVLEPTMPLHNKAKKSNWIADRMKKLIKPRGKDVREGRAQFIAAGSVENLTDISEHLPQPPASAQDPTSAPVSPSTVRRAPGDTDEQPQVTVRSSRRKLGSRHGWGMGGVRGGVISQSFSPGDHRPSPRERFHSQATTMVTWERDRSSTLSQESLTEEPHAESEDNPVTGDIIETHRVPSAAEDCPSVTENQVMKTQPST